MVEDGVPVEADTVFFREGGEGEEFVFGAPFCCYAALLVEFTEVVEIVDVVAVALGGRVSMVGAVWWGGRNLRWENWLCSQEAARCWRYQCACRQALRRADGCSACHQQEHSTQSPGAKCNSQE